MRDKLINVKNCLMTCLIIIMFSGIAYAGPNSSATCGLDMNFSTTDIEADIAASAGDIITVAVVAGGVSNLDTYQAEVLYDTAGLEFIEGYEEVPMSGIRNLLKTNRGTTLGFQAVEKEPGTVNIANTLTGTDTSEAPEGSGILAIIKFRVLEDDPGKISLANVHFVDSSQAQDIIRNTAGGNVN